ncbi:Fe2OG dioxygenase domain-containing protein [Citrus sinensis]|uniref:Fe2OG dioxygenase domain-containing protein n=1 Tax=Citrus sinensis TaxID=2711 RepID=A0ACB8P5P7_CITSI|nr:Fe2OG dioxygenase domain-containing protein [Citrus sinensis]
MAETTSPVKLEAPTETPQELIISGKESLENYIQKGSDAGTFDASLPPLEIPIIDFGLLTSPSSSSQELEKLRSALCSWGCFQVINHGVEPALLNKVREATKQFFGLPLAEKKKYYQEDGNFDGYGNDKMQTLHWSHLLYLTVHPEDKRQLKFWPENPEYFRETLDEFSKQSEVINQILLKAFARSLNMEENCFLDMFGEQALMLARFNWYPPCPRPDLVLGVFPHTDGSGLTMLLPDKEVGGLQFLKDNQWYSVTVIPEAFVVNVGDQLEVRSC